MFNDPIKFYLIKSGSPTSLDNDLEIISQQLGVNSDSGYGIKKDDNSITISYNNTPIKSILKIKSELPLSDTVVSNQMILTCEKVDNVSINLIKGIVKSMGYRIYNPTIESFTATDPNLMDLTTAQTKAGILRIFLKKKMVPIYRYINSLVFYVKDQKDGSIHLINRHLLQYALDTKTDISKADDFSVKFCSDMATFVALADRGMIPTSFYHALHVKQDKVLHINLSGFDLNKVDSDLYLSPVFFSLDRDKQQFKPLRRRGLMILDKIEKGKSLRKYTSELVINHNIKPLIAVKYPQDIEFHKDKKGELFPRMNISIFVDVQ